MVKFEIGNVILSLPADDVWFVCAVRPADLEKAEPEKPFVSIYVTGNADPLMTFDVPTLAEGSKIIDGFVDQIHLARANRQQLALKVVGQARAAAEQTQRIAAQIMGSQARKH